MPILTNSILQRITLVMASTTLGGLEKHVTELALGLSSRGYEVTVIADGRYRDDFTNSKVNFVALDFSRSRRNPILLWQLYQAIVDSRPDVLHLHANKAAQLFSNITKFGQFKNLPVVGSLHSQKSNTKMFTRCDVVIAVSEIAKRAISDQRLNVQVVLNGIEPPQILSKQPKQSPIVLTVGRLEKVKGYDVLIKAWQDIEAELWIVGDGSLKDEYMALIEQQPHLARIKLLGYRTDINALMHQADLFVMSSHYEGCPYVMVEALMTDTPMVSTKVGAMVDILPEAYLANINDSQDLHDKIKRALQQREQTQQDYAPVFAWTKQQLTFDKMLDNIVAIYEQVDKKDC